MGSPMTKLRAGGQRILGSICVRYKSYFSLQSSSLTLGPTKLPL